MSAWQPVAKRTRTRRFFSQVTGSCDICSKTGRFNTRLLCFDLMCTPLQWAWMGILVIKVREQSFHPDSDSSRKITLMNGGAAQPIYNWLESVELDTCMPWSNWRCCFWSSPVIAKEMLQGSKLGSMRRLLFHVNWSAMQRLLVAFQHSAMNSDGLITNKKGIIFCSFVSSCRIKRETCTRGFEIKHKPERCVTRRREEWFRLGLGADG